jgi:hypothetical protein
MVWCDQLPNWDRSNFPISSIVDIIPKMLFKSDAYKITDMPNSNSECAYTSIFLPHINIYAYWAGVLYYEKLKDAKLASDKWLEKQSGKNTESSKRADEDEFMTPVDRLESMSESDELEVEEVFDFGNKSVLNEFEKSDALEWNTFVANWLRKDSLAKVEEESNDQSFVSSPDKTLAFEKGSSSYDEFSDYVFSGKHSSSDVTKEKDESLEFYKSKRRETAKDLRVQVSLLRQKHKHSHTVRFII